MMLIETMMPVAPANAGVQLRLLFPGTGRR